MSFDKVKRQQRRKQDSLVVAKQLRICLYHNADITVPLGSFRKQKALNCGRSRCMLCTNPRYTWGHVTIPELRADESYAYALSNV